MSLTVEKSILKTADELKAETESRIKAIKANLSIKPDLVRFPVESFPPLIREMIKAY